MSRYIDADKGLRGRIQRKTKCNFITADEIVEGMPTAEVIPLDRIKEAVTELDNAYDGLDVYDPDALGTYACRVDEIFSKMIAEVEG